MASSTPLADLSAAGVSIWLDDLSRQRIESGNLASLIEESEVVGVTSNPTIFAGAFADADHYAEDLDALAARGASVEDAIRELTT
ncbi:MAG TPA: transaldolase family protein, partial [Actinomycetospora sp.]|nr:transaldolase family protein [Actinomycetospora sp.]